MDSMGNPALFILAAITLSPCFRYIAAQPQEGFNSSPIIIRRLIREGEWPRAEILVRAELVNVPASPDAHSLLGLVLFHEQRPSESLAEYTLAAKLRTPGVEDLLIVASDYILLKDYGDADYWLTRVTQLVPGMASGWYLLGRTQYNENRIADAESSFLTCLRIDPHHVKAEYNLGLVYENSQRTELAIDAYRKAIKWQEDLSNPDPQPFLDLAMLLRRQGHIEQAIPYLLAAKRNGPKNPMTLAQLGLCYEQLNRFDEAIAELKQALVLSPDVQALHFFLGQAYRRAGRSAEATSEFGEAAKLSGVKSGDGIPNE